MPPATMLGDPLLAHAFDGIIVRYLDQSRQVLIVELNRPSKLNAMDWNFWRDYSKCFPLADPGAEPSGADAFSWHDGSVRCVVVCGAGKGFSAGLDVKDPLLMDISSDAGDPARRALRGQRQIQWMQWSLSAAERCPVPVVCALHGACVGAGLDLATACDVRWCAADAAFSVREVQLGLAADVGTLQRLPTVVGHASEIKELCYTGRTFGAAAAARIGLVSRVVDGSGAQVRDAALELAQRIAALSPVAVTGTKAALLASRDQGVAAGLNQVATWNGAGLQAKDLTVAAIAKAMGKAPVFSRL